jgi:predicted dehydrogenase
MVETVGWGILGTGSIADRFAQALGDMPEAHLVAVGSRSAASADTFGDRFAIPHRHPSYEALVNDSDVDVVYVATPNPFHKDNTLLALQAGRGVLVEKPFAMNSAEAEAMVTAARKRHLFLMEAMWTRFLPLYVRLRQLLAEGALGEVQAFTADFGIRADPAARPRLFEPGLGGGSLLDLGIYPLSLSSMLFGSPQEVAAVGRLGADGIDESAAVVLRSGSGQLAAWWVSITSASPTEAQISGTLGSVRVHRFFNRATTMTLCRPGQPDEVIEAPFRGNGYSFEAAEVMARLRSGDTESPVMPLDESLALIQTMDQIRAQIGVTYPAR